jgi:hypothetical protein
VRLPKLIRHRARDATYQPFENRTAAVEPADDPL